MNSMTMMIWSRRMVMIFVSILITMSITYMEISWSVMMIRFMMIRFWVMIRFWMMVRFWVMIWFWMIRFWMIWLMVVRFMVIRFWMVIRFYMVRFWMVNRSWGMMSQWSKAMEVRSMNLPKKSKISLG